MNKTFRIRFGFSRSDNRQSKIQNRKWAGLFAIVLALTLVGAVAEAQQQANKIPRIGYLTGTREPTRDAPDANRDAFRQGLRDLRYIEGKDIQVEYRYAAGNTDRAPGLVAELVQLKVEALVSPDRAAIRAAKQATETIPIVMVTNGDPVADGFVQSLVRPGGNITGVTRLVRELSGKRLELLKELVPTVSRVGVLGADTTTARNSYKDYEPAARALKLALQFLEVRSSNPNFDEAFRAVAKDRVSALITLRNPLLIDNRKRIAELAIQNRLPSMSEGSVFVEAR